MFIEGLAPGPAGPGHTGCWAYPCLLAESLPAPREAEVILMATIKWAARWGRRQILGEYPAKKQKKKPDGVSDVLCQRQGPLKGELKV